MKSCSAGRLFPGAVLFVACLGVFPTIAQATSLAGDAPLPGPGSSPKDDTVTKYLDVCRGKSAKDANCDKVKKAAVEILKEDLRTLGSSADRGYLPTILSIFKSDEVELRVGAADAIGMIGPQATEFETLASAANDPVPDVRQAIAQMFRHGRGELFSSFSERMGLSTGHGGTPDTPPDPGKYKLPVFPGSVYLFYASNVDNGRLSFVTQKGMNDTMAFFKSKATRGPLKLEEFRQAYRDQLEDERKAREAALQQTSREMEHVKPDPANLQAFMQKLQQAQDAIAAQRMTDSYPPDLLGAPTVYVLEERQIGQRRYPTRYAVLYQDKALNRPGFQLCWTTVSDENLKLAQVQSILESQRMERQTAKEEEEELAKRGLKKKGGEEQKTFKQEQADLEKALGF